MPPTTSSMSTADLTAEEKPSERRAREKKDPNRPHKSRSSKPRAIDPETGEPVRRRRREKDGKEESLLSRSTMADVVPEMSRTTLVPGERERETFPYPSLSKAHCKESVYSLVEVGKMDGPAKDVYTPEPTDVGGTRMGSRESLDEKTGSRESLHAAQSKNSRTNSRESLHAKPNAAAAQSKERPLTPPDTELSQQRKSSVSAASRTTKLREESEKLARPGSRSSERSWFGRPKIVRDDRSKVSTKSRESRASTARRSSKPKVEVVDDYFSDETHSQSGLDSNATSVAPKRSSQHATTVSGGGGRPPGLDTDSGQSNRESASPRTPTATTHSKFDAHDPKQFARDFRPTPSPFVSFDAPSETYDSPQPPPPPPPPMLPMSIPRVDYLMQHGGLSRPVPKHLLAVTASYPTSYPSAGRSTGPPDIANVFSPFSGLLDQYDAVLAKNGSVAVATGYRSIARKLLDRLENVFARELSSEGCTCAMCEDGDDDARAYAARALGWGDVLEWVSGRRALPAWPAFDFASLGSGGVGLGISGDTSDGRPASPQQQAIDPDIADEFREHYLRQSKKTKAAVDRWLSATPATAAPAPPPDIDDETLTFTLLTHLPPADRPIFSALLTGRPAAHGSSSRAPTPLGAPRSEFVLQTSQALQRLYRLAAPPRAPEAAVYLLRNPRLHHLLATLALINASEWEILVSGRFDGFLWSGADDEFADPSRPASRSVSRASAAPSNFPSRGPTPSTFPPSRGPTPMSVPGTPYPGRNPVSNDEETEIAVLAELEREIYAGMEALEDAFEALHRKAEAVRQGLRVRGAGLQMAAQARRGGAGEFARLGTPAAGAESGWGGGYDGGMGSEGESEWAADDDGRSEIAPDDSASNISSSRHRRPKRRNERRTPAPVEEEEEEE